MAQMPIELILTRHLAATLSTPVFLVDPEGTLVFYNEAAEVILGVRFDETGEMPAGEWATVFTPTDDAGLPLAPDALPLAITLRQSRPTHASLRIRGLDGVARRIGVTAFPLIGQTERLVGAVAIFWEERAP